MAFADTLRQLGIVLERELQDGDVLVYSASRDTLVLRGQPRREVQILADAAAVAAAVPDFLGQLAVNLDDGELSYGSALEAGGWTLVTGAAPE